MVIERTSGSSASGLSFTGYEIKVPAASLGLDVLSAGDVIAVGVCVNDGDLDAGQGGQKGWSGWGPHAAVFGKTPSETGLVTLSDTPLDDACTGLDAKRQNALNIYYNVGCIQAEETHDFLDEINPDSITWVGNSIQDRETPDGASNVQFVDLGCVSKSCVPVCTRLRRRLEQ